MNKNIPVSDVYWGGGGGGARWAYSAHGLCRRRKLSSFWKAWAEFGTDALALQNGKRLQDLQCKNILQLILIF